MTAVPVIDKDPGYRFRIKRALEREGHRVRVVPSMAQGLTIVREWPADVAFVHMDGGMEIFGRLCAEASGLRIVAVSDFPQGGVQPFLLEARRAGAVWALTKPFDDDGLLDALWRVCPQAD